MIATVLGLKIGYREPAFPNDALGESLRSFVRLPSADMLLTRFLGEVASVGRVALKM